jgi:hypothetical protein
MKAWTNIPSYKTVLGGIMREMNASTTMRNWRKLENEKTRIRESSNRRTHQNKFLAVHRKAQGCELK